MRILVLGGGVIGVATAFELLKDGHEVTVVEREQDVALGTSFANAGMVAPGHAFAWASPRAPKILLKSLWRDDQALRFRFSLDPALWKWSLKFLRECTAERAIANTRRKHRLATYSQKVLEEISSEIDLKYDESRTGLLYFYRTAQSMERGVANMKILRDLGQEQEILDGEGLAQLEPALEGMKDKLAGGIFCPTDSVGDARKFTQSMAEAVRARGGMVLCGTTIHHLETEGDRVTGVITDKGRLEADAYIVSLGIHSPQIAKALGLDLPIYPIKGYSLTFPTTESNRAPVIGGVDEDNLIAYSRLGDRLRVTATAEFAGYNDSHKPTDFKVMFDKIKQLLPNGVDYEKPSYWAGLRPMTPDGTPYIGPTKHRNAWLNTGHGHIGWTMSCGSARIMRDMIAGRKPEIPLDGLSLR